jgi:DNA repair protein RadC
MPAETRPRERLVQLGVSALSDAELVALVLGSGRRGASAIEVASQLLAEHGSLSDIARAGPEELVLTSAVGGAKAASLVAAFELGRRVETRSAEVMRITGPADIAAAVRPHVIERAREEIFLVVLGGGNRVRRVERIAYGGVTACGLEVGDVLAAVLRHQGRALALVHTHPSGDPAPSAEDISTSRSLEAAARHVGLRLLDHVILAGNRWASLATLGHLDTSGWTNRD